MSGMETVVVTTKVDNRISKTFLRRLAADIKLAHCLELTFWNTLRGVAGGGKSLNGLANKTMGAKRDRTSSGIKQSSKVNSAVEFWKKNLVYEQTA